MEISLKTLLELNRLLGVIQGAAFGAPSNISCVICDTVDAIDELLQKAEADSRNDGRVLNET